MTEVLSSLRRLTWRGIEALFTTDASYTFTRRLAPRKYPYLDVDGHDDVGRDSSPITVTCYFMESLKTGSYFQDWPKFREAAKDENTSGILVHPDLGQLRARVQTGSVTINSQGRSGVIVQVTFVETRDTPDEAPNAQPPVPDAKEAAKAADASIAALRVKYPDGLGATDLALAEVAILYPSGETTGSVFDLINGVIGSFHAAATTLSGKVNQASLLLNQMVDGIQALDDPEAWPGVDNLIQAWASLNDAADKVAAAERPKASKTLTADTTLDAFADSVGNTLTEVAGLNPSALFSPLVEKGTTLFYFAA